MKKIILAMTILSMFGLSVSCDGGGMREGTGTGTGTETGTDTEMEQEGFGQEETQEEDHLHDDQRMQEGVEPGAGAAEDDMGTEGDVYN
jgi:hypothetical protein